MKFASPEYMEEVKKRSNSDAEYLKLAEGATGSYSMQILAEPDKGVPNDIIVGYEEVDGKIGESWQEKRDTDFTLTAKYGVWVDILIGKLNAVKALSLRRLKVRGSFIKLLKSRETDRWVEILMSIPTEFEGDYAQFNRKGYEL